MDDNQQGGCCITEWTGTASADSEEIQVTWLLRIDEYRLSKLELEEWFGCFDLCNRKWNEQAFFQWLLEEKIKIRVLIWICCPLKIFPQCLVLSFDFCARCPLRSIQFFPLGYIVQQFWLVNCQENNCKNLPLPAISGWDLDVAQPILTFSCSLYCKLGLDPGAKRSLSL